MKAILFSTIEEWDSNNSLIEKTLGIPTNDGKTTEYDTIKKVQNESHPNYGKYILLIKTEGSWKCDNLFSEGLVDYDESWLNEEEL